LNLKIDPKKFEGAEYRQVAGQLGSETATRLYLPLAGVRPLLFSELDSCLISAIARLRALRPHASVAPALHDPLLFFY
jgi:hypothetical protein